MSEVRASQTSMCIESLGSLVEIDSDSVSRRDGTWDSAFPIISRWCRQFQDHIFFFIDKVLSSLPDRTQEELSTDQYRSVCVFVIVESVHLRQL